MREGQSEIDRKGVHIQSVKVSHFGWEECQRLSVITALRMINLLGKLWSRQEETAGSHNVAIFVILRNWRLWKSIGTYLTAFLLENTMNNEYIGEKQWYIVWKWDGISLSPTGKYFSWIIVGCGINKCEGWASKQQIIWLLVFVPINFIVHLLLFLMVYPQQPKKQCS